MKTNRLFINGAHKPNILALKDTHNNDWCIRHLEKSDQIPQSLHQISQELNAPLNFDVNSQIILGSGPGSFTGIRCTLSYMKGLLFNKNISLALVNSMHCYLFAYLLGEGKESKFSQKTLFLCYSSKGEFYYSANFEIYNISTQENSIEWSKEGKCIRFYEGLMTMDELKGLNNHSFKLVILKGESHKFTEVNDDKKLELFDVTLKGKEFLDELFSWKIPQSNQLKIMIPNYLRLSEPERILNAKS